MSEKSFSLDDQLAFAELSGDYNPLHIDPIKARRTLFGEVVVHGIHGVLWALNHCEALNNYALKDLKASFHQPIPLDTEVSCKWENLGDLKFAVKISNSHQVYTTLSIELQDYFPFEENIIQSTKDFSHPTELSIENAESSRGKLSFSWNQSIAEKLFPNLNQYSHLYQFAFLLNSTEVVGMQCPGLHSLYSSIQVNYIQGQSDQTCEYHIQKVDPRFNLLLINLESQLCKANIKAFFRPMPNNGISINEAIQTVQLNEFSHQKALIIGGSRGLGATAAKLLSAGGADTTITYAQGIDEANQLQAQLAEHNLKLKALKCNLLDSEKPFLHIRKNEYTHLYYFASPKIKTNESSEFHEALFEHFQKFYVHQFKALVEHLEYNTLKEILYPSTIYIEEQPKNLKEYVKAKLEGEEFCLSIKNAHPNIKLSRPRYPKLATDQTADLKAIEQTSSLEVIYKSLISFGSIE